MKNKIKKATTALSFIAICIVPTINSLSVSASTSTYDSYRLYFDVNNNSSVSTCSVSYYYNHSDFKFLGNPFFIGNLGGNVSGGGGRGFGVTNYTSDQGNINNSGTLFTLLMGSKGYIWNNFDSFNVTVKDKDGNVLNPSLVKISTVLVGDANDDGKVDDKDITAIYNYLTDPNLYPLNSERGADTNGDYIVDFTDAVNIHNYLNGQIEGFYKY